MNDNFYEMSAKMKELFPSNPEADKKALMAMAGNQAPTETPIAVRESVDVPQGSLQIDKDYSVSDFAALAGVKLNETQKTGSAGQAKGKDPTPKMSKPSNTGEQPHPLKDKLVGEDDIDVLALTPSASSVGGAINPEVDDAPLIARGLKKAANGEILEKNEREAIRPYVGLMAELMTNPAFRSNIISMQKVLDKSKNKDKDNKEEESIKERLYNELRKRKI
jgi:hypothetical protein